MRGMATAIALHSALGDNDVWFRRVVSLVSQQDGVRATRTQSSIAPEQSRQPERPTMRDRESTSTPAAPVTAIVELSRCAAAVGVSSLANHLGFLRLVRISQPK